MLRIVLCCFVLELFRIGLKIAVSFMNRQQRPALGPFFAK